MPQLSYALLLGQTSLRMPAHCGRRAVLAQYPNSARRTGHCSPRALLWQSAHRLAKQSEFERDEIASVHDFDRFCASISSATVAGVTRAALRLSRHRARYAANVLQPAISARRSKDLEAVSSLAVRCQPLCELCLAGTLPSLSASRITAYRHLLQRIDTYDET